MFGVYAVFAGSVSIRFIGHFGNLSGARAVARETLTETEFGDDRLAWLGNPSMTFITEDNEDEQITGPILETFLPK